LVVQIFDPLMTQPPSTFTPLVRTAARSEPDSGSLMPMPKKQVPAQMRGRMSRLARSLPWRRTCGPDCRSAIQCAPQGAPAASISPVMTKREKLDSPCPPYSFGQVTPMRPAAPARALNPGSKVVQDERCGA
jgi:hypothetical protein